MMTPNPFSHSMHILRVVAAIAVLTFSSVLSAHAQTAAEKAAMAQVQALLKSAQGAVNSRRGSTSGQVSAVRSVVNRYFAVRTWESALVAPVKSKFSSSERSQFRKLLPSYLARLYVNQFGGGASSAGKVTGARTARKDVLVSAKLPRGRGSGTVNVVWRVRNVGGRPRVIDYSIGGVSNLVLKRSEFTSRVKRSGASSLNSFLASFVTS